MDSLMDSWEVCTAAAVAVCACMLGLLMFTRKKPGHDLHRLPSPPGWPIFGHLYSLQPPLHRCLHKLAQTYGPLFLLKLGTVPTLVVSSPHWAKEFLHAHDRDLVNRPQMEAGKHILYNNTSLTMAKYGPSWRHLRKLFVSHILTSRSFEMFEDARHQEMALLIHSIQSRASIDGATVDFRNMLFSALGNMLTRMMFSKRAFDTTEAMDGGGSPFKRLIEEATVLFATPVLGDVIPCLSWFDAGVKRRMRRVGKQIDAFLEGVLEERIESRTGGLKDADEGASDYLDLLLSLYTEDGKIDKQSIKVILLDMLAAGSETTVTTMEWAMAELLKNPSCMKKLQEEIDMASKERNMQALRDADLAKLSYLQAVVKESLRLHPAVSVVFRSFSDALEQGIQVGGFHLPNTTRVLINVWALGRDPALWGDNAHSFSPERFLGNSALDARGQNFQFLPFGTGRRGCPGMNFALTAIPFIVANLVQAVNWSIPNGVPLDLSEKAAFTAPMANHLVAKPLLRTHG